MYKRYYRYYIGYTFTLALRKSFKALYYIVPLTIASFPLLYPI